MTLPLRTPKIGETVLVRHGNISMIGPEHPALVTASYGEGFELVAVHAFPHMEASYFAMGLTYWPDKDNDPAFPIRNVWRFAD